MSFIYIFIWINISIIVVGIILDTRKISKELIAEHVKMMISDFKMLGQSIFDFFKGLYKK